MLKIIREEVKTMRKSTKLAMQGLNDKISRRQKEKRKLRKISRLILSHVKMTSSKTNRRRKKFKKK